jgi:2-polyprenyl-3-methyl-5-hydroxy-6-metoxy-1,4-benzoquinol methylase
MKRGLPYYEVIGTYRDGVMQEQPNLGELIEAIGDFPQHASTSGKALEIGCGISPYLKQIQRRGYSYLSLDLDREAIKWVNSQPGARGILTSFDEFASPHNHYDLIVALHVLEHVVDPIAFLTKCYDLLKPQCPLYVITPNDDDLTNPDHLWFFNMGTLASTLFKAGFEDMKLAQRQHVKHEAFIYAIVNKQGDK